MPSSPKPAFGQVWHYIDTTMMLIHPGAHHGYWFTICLSNDRKVDGFMSHWAGLPGSADGWFDEKWELLSEEDK